MAQREDKESEPLSILHNNLNSVDLLFDPDLLHIVTVECWFLCDTVIHFESVIFQFEVKVTIAFRTCIDDPWTDETAFDFEQFVDVESVIGCWEVSIVCRVRI